MFESKELEQLLVTLPSNSYKYAVSPREVTLNDQMGALLGQTKRKLIRILNTVIEAYQAKLFLERVDVAESNVDVALKTMRASNDFDKLEREISKAVIRDGETYVLVTVDIDGNVQYSLRDTFDGKEGAAYVYNKYTHAPEYGVNIYYIGVDTYIDVYFPERIEKYIRRKDNHEFEIRKDSIDEEFPIAWVNDSNEPLGIALVRFGSGKGEIVDAVQIQTDINNAILDLTAVSRNQGFPQRYIKGLQDATMLTNPLGQQVLDITGTPISRTFKSAPASTMLIPDKDAEIGQLPAAPIDRTAIDVHLDLMSEVTAVPLFRLSGNAPSGVALERLESRLSARVEAWQSVLSPSYVEMFTLSLRLSNVYNGTAYATETTIELVWYPPVIETESVRQSKIESRTKVATELRSMGILSSASALRYILTGELPLEQDIEKEVARAFNDSLNA